MPEVSVPGRMAAFSFSREDVLLTTESTVPGRDVRDHLGLVVADVTPGRNVGDDVPAGLRDVAGGRSASWEETLADEQRTAMEELVGEAADIGADAVVGVSVADEALGGRDGVTNVRVTGTAVSLE